MIFKIDRVKNGYTMVDDDGEVYVHQMREGDGEEELWCEFLSDLTMNYGPGGGKYSDKRVYIVVAPGYKNDLWESIDCPLCLRGVELEKEME